MIFDPQHTPDDWRVEFDHGGERIGRWVSSGATREDALLIVMRSLGIMRRDQVSGVMIRRRKEVERWQQSNRRAW